MDGCAVPEHPLGFRLVKYSSLLALPAAVCQKAAPVPHQTGLHWGGWGVIPVFEDVVGNVTSQSGDEVSLAYHFTLIKFTMSCKMKREKQCSHQIDRWRQELGCSIGLRSARTNRTWKLCDREPAIIGQSCTAWERPQLESSLILGRAREKLWKSF